MIARGPQPNELPSQNPDAKTGGMGGDLDNPSDSYSLPKAKNEIRMLARSTRWPMTRRTRNIVLKKILDALEETTKPREIASLTRALVACEAQNQSDDQLYDRNRRLDEGGVTDRMDVKSAPAISDPHVLEAAIALEDSIRLASSRDGQSSD